MSIPTIDISCLLDTSTAEKELISVGVQIRESCEKYGIFYVTDHAVSDSESAFKCSKMFFDLDSHTKSSIPIKSGGFTRGYVGLGSFSYFIFHI